MIKIVKDKEENEFSVYLSTNVNNWVMQVEVDFLMKLFLDLAISQENLDEWTR